LTHRKMWLKLNSMPRRKTIFAIGEYYHIFNRSLYKRPIFVNNPDCKRAITALSYYRYPNPPHRLSYYLSFGVDKREDILTKLAKKDKLVEIISYCFMPNHYHLLLKQNLENGISNFIRLFQNSYTRYFNTKYRSAGYLFEGQFKSKYVEDENYLLHLNRYIHLNPYSSHVIKDLNEIITYPYSSFSAYLKESIDSFVSPEIITSQFKNKVEYRNFVLDYADHQKELQRIKHLVLE